MLSAITVNWYAIMVAVGEATIIALLMQVIRIFGQYTKIVLATYEKNERMEERARQMEQRNLIMQQDNLDLADRLAECLKKVSPHQEKSA